MAGRNTFVALDMTQLAGSASCMRAVALDAKVSLMNGKSHVLSETRLRNPVSKVLC